MNTIFLLRQVLRVGLCACVFGCSQRTVMDSQCVESPDPHADDAESITGNDATAHEGSDSGDDDSASESQPDSADNLPADTDTKEDTGVVGSDPDTTGDTAPPVDSEPPAPCAPPDGFDAVAVDYSFMGRGNDTLAEAIRAIRSSTGEMYDILLIFAAQSDWNARTGGIALPDMDWSTHGLVLAMAEIGRAHV